MEVLLARKSSRQSAHESSRHHRRETRRENASEPACKPAEEPAHVEEPSSDDDLSDFIEHDSTSEREDDEYKSSSEDEEDDESNGEEEAYDDEGRAEGAVVAPSIDEGIDSANIVHGKRRRKPVQRFTDQLMRTEEYRKMMLCDIPAEEMKAALEDENFSEDEESAGDPYETDEQSDAGDTKPSVPSNHTTEPPPPAPPPPPPQPPRQTEPSHKSNKRSLLPATTCVITVQ